MSAIKSMQWSFPRECFKHFECPILLKVLTDMEKKTSCDCYFFPVLAVGGHWSEVEGRPGEGGQARAPGGRGDTHRQPAAAPSGCQAGQVNRNTGSMVISQSQAVRSGESALLGNIF